MPRLVRFGVSLDGELSKKFDILIPGLQFKKYLFGIWLGEDPVDDNIIIPLVAGTILYLLL